jgi:hypothetical protein
MWMRETSKPDQAETVFRWVMTTAFWWVIATAGLALFALALLTYLVLISWAEDEVEAAC